MCSIIGDDPWIRKFDLSAEIEEKRVGGRIESAFVRRHVANVCLYVCTHMIRREHVCVSLDYWCVSSKRARERGGGETGRVHRNNALFKSERVYNAISIRIAHDAVYFRTDGIEYFGAISIDISRIERWVFDNRWWFRPVDSKIVVWLFLCVAIKVSAREKGVCSARDPSGVQLNTDRYKKLCPVSSEHVAVSPK